MFLQLRSISVKGRTKEQTGGGNVHTIIYHWDSFSALFLTLNYVSEFLLFSTEIVNGSNSSLFSTRAFAVASSPFKVVYSQTWACYGEMHHIFLIYHKLNTVSSRIICTFCESNQIDLNLYNYETVMFGFFLASLTILLTVQRCSMRTHPTVSTFSTAPHFCSMTMRFWVLIYVYIIYLSYSSQHAGLHFVLKPQHNKWQIHMLMDENGVLLHKLHNLIWSMWHLYSIWSKPRITFYINWKFFKKKGLFIYFSDGNNFDK